MRSLFTFIARLLGFSVLAGCAILWAWVMAQQLYQYRSPLQERAPAPGDLVGPRVSRRVVVVMVDALRYDAALNAEWMPNLARLREQSAWARMTSRPPSYSQTGYTTLFTGAWPELNDSAAFNLDDDEIHTWTQDNLFSAAARQGLGTAVSGYQWLERLIPADAVSAGAYTGLDGAQSDRLTVDAALPWLSQPERYSLVLLHLTQVDHAGHYHGGLRSGAVIEAAQQVDELLAEILATVDLSQDTLLLVSDHGQTLEGTHGGHDPVTLREPFILAGKGARPGEYESIQMVDVAPTLSALLGLNLPASTQGRVLVEMLDLPEETLAALPVLEARQQKRLYEAYTATIAHQPAPDQGDGSTGKLSRLANLNWLDWVSAILGRAKPALAVKEAGVDESLAFASRDAEAWRAATRAARDSRLGEERLLRAVFALPLVLIAAAGFWRWRDRMKGVYLFAALFYLGLVLALYTLTGERTFSYSSTGRLVDFAVFTAWSSSAALFITWAAWAWRMGTFRLLLSADEAGPLRAARRSLDLVSVILGMLSLPVLINYLINGIASTWTLPSLAVLFWGQYALLQAAVVLLAGMALGGLVLSAGTVAQFIRTSPTASALLERSAHFHAATPPADPPIQNA